MEFSFSSPSEANATELHARQAASVDLFQGLEGDGRMDAIVQLVRAVASGRRLPVYPLALNQRMGIVLGVLSRSWGVGGFGGYKSPVACS